MTEMFIFFKIVSLHGKHIPANFPFIEELLKFLFDTHTHTHTHIYIYKERKKERKKDGEICASVNELNQQAITTEFGSHRVTLRFK